MRKFKFCLRRIPLFLCAFFSNLRSHKLQTNETAPTYLRINSRAIHYYGLLRTSRSVKRRFCHSKQSTGLQMHWPISWRTIRSRYRSQRPTNVVLYGKHGRWSLENRQWRLFLEESFRRLLWRIYWSNCCFRITQ